MVKHGGFGASKTANCQLQHEKGDMCMKTMVEPRIIVKKWIEALNRKGVQKWWLCPKRFPCQRWKSSGKIGCWWIWVYFRPTQNFGEFILVLNGDFAADHVGSGWAAWKKNTAYVRSYHWIFLEQIILSVIPSNHFDLGKSKHHQPPRLEWTWGFDGTKSH